MLVSARNAPQTWDLRCEIREKMIGWIQSEMPEMLPRGRMDVSGEPVRGWTGQASAGS